MRFAGLGSLLGLRLKPREQVFFVTQLKRLTNDAVVPSLFENLDERLFLLP
jgi:hypothetical protein